MNTHSTWNKAQQIRIRKSIEKFKDSDPQKYQNMMNTFNEKLKTNQDIPDCILEAGTAVIRQYNAEIQEQIDQMSKNSNIPTCPTCKSTSIHKISNLNKIAHVGLFGIFSIGKISKQFHCNNCGYEW